MSSTPEDLSQIPPVLRHRQENVQIILEPALEGFSKEDSAQGTLYVVERSVPKAFTSSVQLTLNKSVLAFISTSGKGFEVPYPAITLHAISRTETGPSIYCQLDESFRKSNDTSAVGNAEDEEESAMSELIIVPSDAASRKHQSLDFYQTPLN